MVNRYLIPACRHLWRHRLFTALNVVGLAIGISACWVIFRIVDYEFSYERGLPNKENIYRVVTGFVFDKNRSYISGVSKPMFQGIRASMPNVDYAVPVFGEYLKRVSVLHPVGKPLDIDEQKGVVSTDSSYFTMLPYRWIAGNRSTAFQAPNSVVLTESRAAQYFPGKKPDEVLNNTIIYYGYRDTISRTVTGVVADYRMPSEFTGQEFCALPAKPYEARAWSNTNGTDKLYLQVRKDADLNSIRKKIDKIAADQSVEFSAKHPFADKSTQWHALIHLKDSHFSTYVPDYDARKASKPVIFGLMGIAIFLLILACINYINVSIASIPQRAKEIGVRKTLGSSRTQLISQFLFETLITTLASSLFSYVFIRTGFWLLADIIPPGVTPFGNIIQLVIFIISLALIITVLAGLYPGWLITKVKAISIFSKTSGRRKVYGGFSLQKALIVFQFAIALIFISCAIIVGDQLHFALSTDMGFNKDAIILAEVPWKYESEKKYENKQFTLINEFRQIPGVRNVSLGEAPMSDNASSSMYDYSAPGKAPVQRQVYKKWIDTAYLKLYGLKLLIGRNLSASDTTNEFVINETAVHAFGFTSPMEALGKLIGQENQKFPVVGVVSDFHSHSFYNQIDPLSFESDKDNLSMFNIKLDNNSSNWPETIRAISAKWYKIYPPDSFSYAFYDESIARMYKKEQNIAKLVNLATAISIFISCLGLFGLAVLTTFQRTKEIGVRKVLGASVASIVRLLSKEYVYLIVTAIAVATPIAYWAMNKWLQNFVYRINIQGWMFLLAGLIAIVGALLTVSFHAVKVARANPADSLRTE